MNDQNENPNPNQLTQDTLDRLENFATYARGKAIFMAPIPEEYQQFPQQLVETMREIYETGNALVASIGENERAQVEHAVSQLIAIVQDGFARLSADVKEGMPYDELHQSLEDERKIWFEQVRLNQEI